LIEVLVIRIGRSQQVLSRVDWIFAAVSLASMHTLTAQLRWLLIGQSRIGDFRCLASRTYLARLHDANFLCYWLYWTTDACMQIIT